MDKPTLDALSQRVDRLERESRWWKGLASLALALLGIVTLLGATAGKKTKSSVELRVQRLVLVDKVEKARAELLITADNQPSLFLADEAGKPRLMLSLTRYGQPSLSFADAGGTRRVVLGVDLYGSVLRFTDDAGNPRAALVVPAEGEPELELMSRDDKVLWRAP
jgi:PHD/YefM family antitoxin component YafN of YafNO toxin-antitoxin module